MRNPYVTGPFVAGRKFYGRRELTDYLLHGANRACWVVGNRRIGKTSLLRQLELQALAEPTLVPLFWDMQGSGDYLRLGQYLTDAARENQARLALLDIPSAALDEEDPAVLLATLRRAAARAGWELLLLCDETEVLIKVAYREPEAVQRLHRELTGGTGLRVVATSTQAIYALHDVCRDWPTSSFLAGFDLSQVLGGLSRQSAAALITQAQSAEPVHAGPELIAAIAESTNNHPYLVQLLCARLFVEDGWLRPLTESHLEVDAVLRGFFNVDFYSLTGADRRILRAAQGSGVDVDVLLRASRYPPAQARLHIHNLERLGYLRRSQGQYKVGNQFLANWLAAEPLTPEEAAEAGPAPKGWEPGEAAGRVLPGSGAAFQAGATGVSAEISDAALQAVLSSRQDQEAAFLRDRLNTQRARLVELEAARARDLLNVSPQVLAEIEQLQTQIGHLRSLLSEVAA